MEDLKFVSITKDRELAYKFCNDGKNIVLFDKCRGDNVHILPIPRAHEFVDRICKIFEKYYEYSRSDISLRWNDTNVYILQDPGYRYTEFVIKVDGKDTYTVRYDVGKDAHGSDGALTIDEQFIRCLENAIGWLTNE